MEAGEIASRSLHYSYTKPLVGMLCARCGVAFLTALALLYWRADISAGYLAIHLLFSAIVIGFSSLSVLSIKWNRLSSYLIVADRVVDVFVATWIIYLTGGPGSPLVFLYLVVVIGAAVSLSRNLSLGVSLLGSFLYGTVAVGLVHQYLPPLRLGSVPSEPAGGVILQVGGVLCAMVLVGIATSYLSRAARSERALVEQTQQDLTDLGLRQRELIDGVSDGLITARHDFTVTSVNRVAEELLGQSSSRIIGRRLHEILRAYAPNISLVRPDSSVFAVPVELVIRRTDGREIALSLTGRYLGERHDSPFLYILKDVTALREIERRLAQQEEMARLLSSYEVLQTPTMFPHFVGESESIKKVFSFIEKVAPSDATVLITGESGTGKELVARSIHVLSHQAAGPFVTVNCGAIPENLLESELFGHKKGAFTGAISDHRGFFREAEGGTLFLDEVGELPLAMQAKLLRTLQERLVRPVGGDSDIKIRVRIVAATNRDLRMMVANGTFREDLFYRLEVLHVALPPLRDRKSDIPLLVRRFIEAYRNEGGADKRGDADSPVISPRAMEIIMGHAYPGNIRELENVLERALVLGGDVILPEHLPESMRFKGEGDSLDSTPSATRLCDDALAIMAANTSFPVNLEAALADLEKRYLLGAIRESSGSQKRAATLLGLNQRSLRYRLQKFGITAPEVS